MTYSANFAISGTWSDLLFFPIYLTFSSLLSIIAWISPIYFLNIRFSFVFNYIIEGDFCAANFLLRYYSSLSTYPCPKLSAIIYSAYSDLNTAFLNYLYMPKFYGSHFCIFIMSLVLNSTLLSAESNNTKFI